MKLYVHLFGSTGTRSTLLVGRSHGGRPGGVVWRLWPPERLESLRKIPRRDIFEGQPRQQHLAAFRPPYVGWQERQVQANPAASTLPHLGHLDAHRTHPGMHLTRRKLAMPDHRVAALGSMAIGILS